MKKIKYGITRLFWAGVLAGELTAVTDLVLGYLGKPISLGVFVALWLVLTGALVAVRGFSWKGQAKVSLILPLVGAVLLALGYAGWRWGSERLTYVRTDEGKQALYGDRKVMAIVPHEDDELNIAGGVLEEYVHYGSQVYVVFATNGDYFGKTDVRIEEAITCCAQMGIPEEQVIFLGYGDQWSEGGPHLYNAQPGALCTSMAGLQQTYGTQTHPAYRSGQDYTLDNFLKDLEDVILEYRPDTILCSDYDAHIDHQALTLAFEKVMGRILQENGDYRPVVYKAFAYNTAWMAEADFYDQINLGATEDIFQEPYNQSPAIYRWEERLRLPVAAQSLSRSLMTTGNYRGMTIHASQGEKKRANSMTNSDKIFWQRRTDSLCYQAEITTSSGEGSLLQDFMLLECHDLVGNRSPYDGVWVPEAGDETPTATVTFPAKTDIDSIVLYDNPSTADNVGNAVICFDDGTRLSTGALDLCGAATVIPVNKSQVTWFRVELEQREGDEAGLTEIEAYCTPSQGEDRLIKVVDAEDNFIYDYWMDPSGTQTFGVYTRGAVGEYTATIQGEGCTVKTEAGKITVTCPQGSSCVLQVESLDGALSDSVLLRNPGPAYRAWVGALRTLEHHVFYNIRQTVVLRTFFSLKRALT